MPLEINEKKKDDASRGKKVIALVMQKFHAIF